MLLSLIAGAVLPQTAIKRSLFLSHSAGKRTWGGGAGEGSVFGATPLGPPEEYKVSVADLVWAALINHPIRAD